MNLVVQRQTGRTLIELLIAMTIGLAISIVIGAIFLTSNQNSRVVDESSVMQDSSRYLQQILSRHIRNAGYSPIVVASSPVFPVSWDNLGSRVGNALVGCSGAMTSALGALTVTCTPGVSDSLEVRSITLTPNATNIANGDSGDCGGTAATASVTVGTTVLPEVVNRFYVGTNPTTGNPELYCLGNGSNTPQPIAQNVEQMIVWYGVDAVSPANDRESVDGWYRAADVPSWDQVTAVRVCLLIRSTQQGVVSSASGDNRFQYQDCLGAQANSATDGRFRRTYLMTVSLRNRVHGSVTPDL